MIGELIILICSLILVRFVSHYARRKKCNAPGPPGWPIIGNWFELETVKPWFQMERWRQKYGDVFKLKLGVADIVVVNGEAIYEVLVTKSDDYMDRPDNGRYKMLTDYHDIITRKSDEKWKDFRKVAHQGLRQYGKGVLRIQELSQDQVLKCAEAFLKTNGEPFNPFDDIFHTIANVALVALSGSAFEKNHEVMQRLKKLDIDANRMLGIDGVHIDVMPCLKYFPHKMGKMVREAVRDQMIVLDMLWDFVKENCDLEKPAGVLPEFFKNQEERKDSDMPLSDEEVYGLEQNLVVGGLFTTTAAVKSMVAYMVDYPDVQRKLQLEIDEVLQGRLPTLDDRRTMPYMEAFILESLRQTSLLPILIPHMTKRDVSLRGYDIPKDTQVWVNAFNLHHDERYFKDPWTFNPDRFLEEDGSLLPTHKRKMLLPFGAGRRVCVGEQFARIRMFLFMTTLLQRLTFLPASPDSKPNYDPRDSIIGFILKMKDYKLRVVKRGV
ncbi:unnamed protein product [Owenia fusiformis]|uniref:Cytochrome P450 n=1 Tax=Owenia fusiformis TaxID=6347 RepID=A0A8J1TLL1_OWEFU|nr:unnamed protein product [Owenia fusiformis]